MKISKLQKFAWVFFALALGTSTLFAQGWRNGNRTIAQNNQAGSCVNLISDLTDKQIDAINELETKHQEEMDALREKRRATVNFEEKDLIREEMLENIVDHRSEVKELLNEDQQKEFEMLQLRGNNFRNQNSNGNFQGRGRAARQGNAMGFRNGNRGFGNGPVGRQNFNNRNFGNCPRWN